MSWCIGFLVACSLTASAAERVQKTQRFGVKASLRDVSGRAAATQDVLAAIASASSACETIGSFTDQFLGANRFRGDVFTITKQVDLIEIQMELAFRTTAGNPSELFFYVFEESTSDPPTFDLVFESRVNATGDGQPTLYASGPVETPGGVPLPLEVGKRYAIGAAWTSTSGSPSTITYGSDGLIYPRPFVAGTIEGLVSINQTPPLTTLGTPIVFRSSGVYSLRLCLSGACCLPNDTCDDLSQINCTNAGGEFTAAGITCADDLAGTCPSPPGACCLGNQTCFDLNEFACNASGGVWNDGVMCGDASDPCAPRGACCRSGQSPPCTPNVTQNRCALLGGTYRGDGVGCDVAPGCGAGACCVAESCVELTPADCGMQPGGVFTGPGTSCSANVCVPTGACCDGLTCSDVTQEECNLIFGALFRGDGTSCATLTTSCGKGACCLPGAGCFDGTGGAGEGVSKLFCESQNGVYRGDGTTCATIFPGCDGACCFGPGGGLCAPQTAPELCWAKFGGDFAGYFANACPSAPDPARCPVVGASACCLPNGGCTETDSGTCATSLGGLFFSGVSCDPTLCLIPTPVGVCCDPATDVCDDNNGAGIEKGSCAGRWVQGVACSDVPDPCLPVGACCDGATCTDGVIAANCAFTWIEGAACSDIPDPCAPTGSCCNSVTFECLEDVVAEACVGANLTFAQGMTCVQAACPTAPVGACCAITSSVIPPCSQQTQANCESLGGQYKGNGVLCADITCGACCQLSGSCQEDAIASECSDPDFDFFNAGFACADVCTPRGACCVDGTCNNGMTPLACANKNGLYAGNSTLCRNGACDIGACCNTNETCANATVRTACEAGGGRFLDAGSVCSSPTDPTCQRGVCCEPDATCTSDKIMLDCAVPGDFVPGSPSCDTAECFVRGACCLPNESCQILSQITCLLNNGIYAGNGTACVPDLCAIGACCDAGLGCTEATKLSCTRTLGTYAGPGSACLSGSDDCLTSRGACCTGGTCSIDTEATCTGGGGSYAGDNVSCDPDLCKVGACCLAVGGCDDSATRFECEGNGDTFIGAGIACLGTADDCATGSCCGLDGTCADGVTANACAVAGGSFDGFFTCTGIATCEVRGCCCDGGSATITTQAACTGNYLGDGKSCAGVDCGVGACCNGNSPCSEVSPASCATGADNYFGDGTTCAGLGVDCSVGACCNPQEVCSMDSMLGCLASGGVTQGGGSDCASSSCVISILSSTPGAGSIDARQPFDPDGTNPAGWDKVDINFAGNPSLITAGDFLVDLVPGGVTVPTVTGVTVAGTSVSVQLDGPIPLNQWTRIQHVSSGTLTWLGNLPGDVDADRTVSGSLDLTAMIGCINNPGTCNLWQCDANRSNTCTPADVLRLIDIISGAGMYAGLSAGSLPALP